MQEKNHLTVNCMLTSADLQYKDIAHYRLSQIMAEELAKSFPVEVTYTRTVNENGEAEEIHTLELFVFSPDQLREYIAEIKRGLLMELAVDRALANMPTEVVH